MVDEPVLSINNAVVEWLIQKEVPTAALGAAVMLAICMNERNVVCDFDGVPVGDLGWFAKIWRVSKAKAKRTLDELIELRLISVDNEGGGQVFRVNRGFAVLDDIDEETAEALMEQAKREIMCV